MSNGRSFRRTLSAAFVGAGLVVGSSAAPVGADQPAEFGEQGQVAPVLWRGTLSVNSIDAIVNARVDALNEQTTGEDAFVNLDGAAADATGVTTIRAEPGEWYDDLKDAQGRVQVSLFASSENGDQFGMELLYVRWVAANDGSVGHWVSDQQLIGADGGQVLAESGVSGRAGSSRVDEPPTSEIAMSAVPGDLGATRSSGHDATTPENRSIYIGGYTCDGPRHLLASGPNWATIGKYYSSAGPTENWTYQTSSSTTTAWGYSGQAGIGSFTLGGKTTFQNGVTTGSGGGGPIAANGDTPWGSAQVQMDYRLYRVDGCRTGGPPTGTNPGQPQTTKLTQLLPYRWTGGLRAPRNAGETPQRISNYTHTIRPGFHLDKDSGVTTSTSNSVEVGIGWSGGFASLSGGVSYTTGNVSGHSISRSWHNPSSNANKYIDSTTGKPMWTSAYKVRGFNH